MRQEGISLLGEIPVFRRDLPVAMPFISCRFKKYKELQSFIRLTLFYAYAIDKGKNRNISFLCIE